MTPEAERYPPRRVLILDALLEASGVSCMALGQSFPAFVPGVAILTNGERLSALTAAAGREEETSVM